MVHSHSLFLINSSFYVVSYFSVLCNSGEFIESIVFVIIKLLTCTASSGSVRSTEIEKLRGLELLFKSLISVFMFINALSHYRDNLRGAQKFI